jgi:tetratricopeptide (TPR) repeat protein
MQIVATMLSGNSESIANDAALSVMPWVDALILIDTGISDHTRDVVSDVAKDRLLVKSFPWTGSFSTARNAALECAMQHGAAWALTIDTDERLAFPGYNSQRELLEHLNAANVPAWSVSDKDGSYAKDRFIKLPTDMRWSGRVHEALPGTFKRQTLPGAYFWELGKSQQQYKEKLERDLHALLEEVASHSENPRWHYYLGQTHEGLGNYRAAISSFDRCARLGGWPDEAAWACFAASRCWVALGEHKKAEECCARGMAIKPSMAELPWMAGWCCNQRGAHSDAITWSQLAICLQEIQSYDSGGVFRYQPAWHEGPYDVLRWSYRHLRNEEEAKMAEATYEKMKRCRLGNR